MKIVDQKAELIAITPDPLFVIEKCGRICYKSEDKMDNCECGGLCEVHIRNDNSDSIVRCQKCMDRAKNFVIGLIKRGHESVLEHVSATFILTTDRGISHELVRHRIASYSQESTRYCNYGNKGGEITVIRPDFSEARSLSDAETDWISAMNASENSYLSLVRNLHVSPQHARSVLPTCLKTEIVITANMRQWRHMMYLRLKDKVGKAHPQIKQLFKLILNEFLKIEVNIIFKEFLDE